MSIEKITNLKGFPIERTIFYLLEEKTERWSRAEKELSSWEIRFPSASAKIKQQKAEKETKQDLDASDDVVLTWFDGGFNEETKILKEVRPDSKKKIEELLTINEEADKSPIVKLLKEVGKGQKIVLEKKISNWNMGVIGLAFLIDSIENFYLTELPKQIQSELDIAEPVKLEELDPEKLKEHIGSIYTDLYTEFTDTKQRKDFEKFQEEINKELEGLKTLIAEKRKEKTPEKPKENIEDIKKELATKSKELSDLKEAWKNNFADRGLGDREYLKEKELSVETINKVGESLKVYDDIFSYMDSKHSPNTVKEWWGKVRPYWKENFAGKYDIIGGIEDVTLIKLKSYIESKEKEINEWLVKFPIKDYPKGAEGIQELISKLKENQGTPSEGGDKEIKEALDKWLKEFPIENYPKGAEEVKIELEGFSAYIERVLDRLEKQDNYILVDEPNKITTDPEEIKT